MVQYFGRQQEAEELLGAIGGVLAEGQGSFFLVQGEPGIGKTSLVTRLVGEASQRGVLPLWCQCRDGLTPAPYRVWAELIRACLKSGQVESQTAAPGAATREIARIVPELGIATAPNKASVPLDPQESRLSLFEAIKTFFEYVAGFHPLLFIIEDLCAADRDSLRFLQFVARGLDRSRILIVATYWDAHARRSAALRELLTRLSGTGRHLHLRGLGATEVQTLVQAVTGLVPDSRALAAICNATAGNPFLVESIVRLMPIEAISHLGKHSGKAVELPNGFRAATLRHLSPLSSRGRSALSLAAVAGGDFSLEVLRQAWWHRPEDLPAGIEEARALGLIAELPEAPARYRFRHAVVREALYGELSHRYLLRAHRSIAKALEELYGRNPEGHLAEFAYHLLKSETRHAAQRAVRYAQRAAEEATAASAFEDATRYYELALAALSPRNRADEQHRCELLVALGRSQRRVGNYTSARSAFLAAGELASTLGCDELLGEAALGYPNAGWLSPRAPDADSVRLVERALQVHQARDDSLQAMLLARLASELYYEPGARARRESAMREAVEIARRLADKSTLVAVLAYRDLTLSGPDSLKERMAGADEIAAIAEEHSDHLSLDLSVVSRLVCFRQLGDLEGMTAQAELLKSSCDVTQDPVRWSVLNLFLASRALAEGRFEEGERTARECVAFLGRVGFTEADELFWPAMLMPFGEQGRLPELEPMARKAVEERKSPIYRAMLAQLHSMLGKKAEAQVEFERLSAGGFAGLPRDHAFLGYAVALAQVCIAAAPDPNRTRQLYDVLLPYAGLNATFGSLAEYGSVAYYLGRLAVSLGRLEQAQSHFEDALAFNDKIGSQAWLAHVRLDYADMLLRRGAQGDLSTALEIADWVLETAKAMGMKALRQKTTALKAVLTQAQSALTTVGRTQSRTFNEEVAATGTFGPELSQSGTSAGVAGSFSKAGVNPEARESSIPQAFFRREGDYWTITYQGSLFRLHHLGGLSCIAYLLSHPGDEVHANQLALVMDRHRPDGGGLEAGAVPGDEPIRLGDAGPAIDPAARTAYQARLVELREELEQARTDNDLGRQAKLSREIDFLAAEMSRSVGLNGRIRRASSASERARLSVTKAIKSALDRISENQAALAQHLSASIRTGTFCSYRPAPDSMIDWKL